MRCWHSGAEFKGETVRHLWLWCVPFGVCMWGVILLSASVFLVSSCGSWSPASRVLSLTEAFSGLWAFCLFLSFETMSYTVD